MKWGLAQSASSRARGAFLNLARDLLGNGPAPRGPAENTATKSKPAGGRNIDLTARAMSLHNRSKPGAQAYLDRHRILAKGLCSDA